jgi:hypothetical protein
MNATERREVSERMKKYWAQALTTLTTPLTEVRHGSVECGDFSWWCDRALMRLAPYSVL